MGNAIERYVIRHLSGSKANQVEEFDFNKNELTIGRATDCNIHFDPEADVVVSREHGKIVKSNTEPPEFSIVDNSSRNGIFVNKVRVNGSSKLSPGDEVQLGSNGPVFVFDVFPRPADMMMSTRVIEIPATDVKATTISELQPADVVSSEPVKTGLGKQTVERMLVAERKKSTSKIAVVLGSLVLVLAILGFAFRSKLFPKPSVTVVKEQSTVVDPRTANKKTPDMIAKENSDRVVEIEFGWQLYDIVTSDELWHVYTTIKDPVTKQTKWTALYIRNQDGRYEPYLDDKRNVTYGEPIGVPAASGSGFVVSEDGFILTNRHVGAGWNTLYTSFAQDAFPGSEVTFENGKMVIIPNVVQANQVYGWVPAEAEMVGGQYSPQRVKGRNTYVNVTFAGTSVRRPVVSSTPSDDHDVCLLKVDIPESLSAVTMKDDYEKVQPGQTVTVMGYPGVAPAEYVARKSNDPFNVTTHWTFVPTPTVTPGNIGRIIPGSSDKASNYSTFGDSYQLTINATGHGNSGGPLFDDEGNVIGIFYAGKSDDAGTQISFAVPIKYGLELMGRKKVGP